MRDPLFDISVGGTLARTRGVLVAADAGGIDTDDPLQLADRIVNAYSLAFFDRHLKGQPAALLDGPAAQ